MITLTTAAQQFIAHREAMNCAASTLRTHQMWLDLWGRWRTAQGKPAALASVTTAEIIAWLTHLRSDYRGRANRALSPQSALTCWVTLRAFWAWAGEEGLLAEEQRTYFPRRVPRPRVPEAIRPTYDDSTLAALLRAAADNEPAAAVRDRALILLLLESGMRASEVCGLELGSIETANRRAQVWGKGGRQAWVYWGEAAGEALTRWLLFRPGRVNHDRVFVSLGRTNYGAPFSYNGLRLMFARLAKRAGVELPDGASIHALRHTFAHDLLDANVQTLHLQQLMRHRDARTTERYTRERPDTLGRVHRRAYRRRGGVA